MSCPSATTTISLINIQLYSVSSAARAPTRKVSNSWNIMQHLIQPRLATGEGYDIRKKLVNINYCCKESRLQ